MKNVRWTDKNRLPMWAVFLLVRPLKASCSAATGMFGASKILEAYTGKAIPHYLVLCALTFGATFVANFFLNGAELLGRLDWVAQENTDAPTTSAPPVAAANPTDPTDTSAPDTAQETKP